MNRVECIEVGGEYYRLASTTPLVVQTPQSEAAQMLDGLTESQQIELSEQLKRKGF